MNAIEFKKLPGVLSFQRGLVITPWKSVELLSPIRVGERWPVEKQVG